MLRAPGPWYPTGQSGGPGAYPTQPLVVSSGRSRVPVWWSLPSSCLLLPVSNVSGSP